MNDVKVKWEDNPDPTPPALLLTLTVSSSSFVCTCQPRTLHLKKEESEQVAEKK